MGALADGFAAFAQPLIDETDGSHEQLEKAIAISQLCYNLAMLPEEKRDLLLSEVRRSAKMNDEDFDVFRRSVVAPMIQRHERMFPRIHQRLPAEVSRILPSSRANSRLSASGDGQPVIDRYAPCPCGSGEKYKFCCGSKRR